MPKIWPPDNTCFCSCPPSLPAWLPQPEKAQISSAPTFFVFPHICLFLTFKCGVVLHLFEINYVCLNFFGLGVDRRVCCLLEIQAAIKLLHCHTHNRQLSWKIRADHQKICWSKVDEKQDQCVFLKREDLTCFVHRTSSSASFQEMTSSYVLDKRKIM